MWIFVSDSVRYHAAIKLVNISAIVNENINEFLQQKIAKYVSILMFFVNNIIIRVCTTSFVFGINVGFSTNEMKVNWNVKKIITNIIKKVKNWLC